MGKKDELHIEADVGHLQEVLDFVDGHLTQYDCDMNTQVQIDIAVEEIYVNIAHYAYPSGKGDVTIQLELFDAPPSLTLTFIDHGIPYNPLAKEDPDTTLSAEEREIGGLGIFMVKESMDYMHYTYNNGCNILKFKKNL